MEGAKQAKNTKFAEVCEQNHLSIQAFVFEALGGWDSNTVTQVKRIAKAMARRDSHEEDTANRHVLQQLSMSFMRGNGSMLMNRREGSQMAELEDII